MRPWHEHQHLSSASLRRIALAVNLIAWIMVFAAVLPIVRCAEPANAAIREHLLLVADSGNGILPPGRSRAHSKAFEHGVHRLADRHPVLIALVIHGDNLPHV
ncbi:MULTISPECIES: hypothetical protein [Aurantimonas]|uniref:hypothetical protein n=1 Tax=Aurantimonas TaxID=182269 RepID=UPI003513CFE8